MAVQYQHRGSGKAARLALGVGSWAHLLQRRHLVPGCSQSVDLGRSFLGSGGNASISCDHAHGDMPIIAPHILP